MRLPLKQLALVALLVLAVFVGGVLYPMWRAAVDRNVDARADPHHIAGNLYFVGSPDLAAFLLLGSEGDALIGSGDERTGHKIVDNIEQLGFDVKNVRMLLATEPFGGLAELRQASGAQVWASDANADVIASGGASDPGRVYTPYRLMAWAGITSYPPARVDHRVKDQETIRLGTLAITAHVVPGTALGCTAWTFSVGDRGRDLRVVHRCGVGVPYGSSLIDPERPPGVRAEFERSVAMLRSLPVDIWLTSHGVQYGRFRKYQASLTAEDPAAPFIDPDGYHTAIDEAEARFRAQLAEQQHQPQ